MYSIPFLYIIEDYKKRFTDLESCCTSKAAGGENICKSGRRSDCSTSVIAACGADLLLPPPHDFLELGVTLRPL